MKSICLAFLAAVMTAHFAHSSFAGAEPGRVSAPAPADPAATRDILSLLEQQRDSWNRGDLVAFMQTYWRSPDLTFSSGTNHMSGWQTTLDSYRTKYQGEGREMGKLRFDDVRIELLGTDAAFVRAAWHLQRAPGPTGGRFTLILRKRPEGWRIIHDHSS